MGFLYQARKGCEPRGSFQIFCYKCKGKRKQSDSSCFSFLPAPFKPAGIYVENSVQGPRPPGAMSVSSSFLSGDGKMKRCTAKYKLANRRLVVFSPQRQSRWGWMREGLGYLIKRRLSPPRTREDKIILSGSTIVEVLMIILTLLWKKKGGK